MLSSNQHLVAVIIPISIYNKYLKRMKDFASKYKILHCRKLFLFSISTCQRVNLSSMLSVQKNMLSC